MKQTIIRTNKLCKSYITGKSSTNVLKNISLDVYASDFTVIMGSSGSGKSTLLYALSTMDQPTSGTINLLGNDVGKLAEKAVAAIRKREIAFVFQSINLLPDLTAFENIAYSGYGGAPKNEVNAKALRLLERFGLQDEKEHYPSELSGGQQQRVAIARALIGNPSVIFCDEPTGALNSASGQEVLDILTELVAEGQSVVMVTHDLKAAARGTRLLYLSDGHIEGDLALGSFSKAEQAAREEIIFSFLQEHGW